MQLCPYERDNVDNRIEHGLLKTHTRLQETRLKRHDRTCVEHTAKLKALNIVTDVHVVREWYLLMVMRGEQPNLKSKVELLVKDNVAENPENPKRTFCSMPASALAV